jgi:hypothetical protein
MTAAITALWPAHHHAVGATHVSAALQNPAYSTWIVLYAGRKPTGRRFYHYVFVWRDRRRYFAQNELDATEYVVRESELAAEYLTERVHCGVPFPQIWQLN